MKAYHDLEGVLPPDPGPGEEVELFLWTEARAGALVYEEAGELHQKPMAPFPGGLRVRVRLGEGPLRYAFRLEAGYLGSHGLEPTLPRFDRFFHLLPWPRPPAWAQGTVYYQIFPDRFRKSAHPLPPPPPHWRPRAWGEPVGRDGGLAYYGGDLYGVAEALPYLEALGVETLYLTPIFPAQSVHRYDVVDYTRVDPLLGGEEALEALRKGLRARGMRLILDGVFNHTGSEHPYFRRALQDPKAPEGGMYTFYPDGRYAAFFGVRSMPKLDYASPLVQERFVHGLEAPIRLYARWADGVRLDVAHGIGEGGTNRGNARWLRALTRAAKEANEEALVFGELSYDTLPTLRAQTLDGAMHYAGFAHPVMEWLSGRDVRGERVRLGAKALWRVVWDHYAGLPLGLRHSMYTLVSSHDIPRALWRLRGDKELFKLAYALLFAFPGSPAVYYGDEIGLSQTNPYEAWAGDPYCRAPFPWEESLWDRDLLRFFQRLIRLKKTHPVLRQGGLLPLKAPPGVLAFRRRLGEKEVWAFFAPQGASLRLPPGRDLLREEEVEGEVGFTYLLLEPYT